MEIIFFIFSIAMLVFSGWWFFKCTGKAGKNIELKIGMAAVGVGLFVAFTTFFARAISPTLRSNSIEVYDPPWAYLFFLVCAGLVGFTGLVTGKILSLTPANFLSGSTPSGDAKAGNTGADRVVRMTAFILLFAGGVAGGSKSWAGAADQLPFIMWLVTLPALAVWFGRRSSGLAQAALVGASFGAVFVLPSFLFYWSRDMGENLLALVASVGTPAIVAAIAHSAKGAKLTASSNQEAIDQRTGSIKMASLLGILVPQLVQPAILDEVRSLQALSVETGKPQIASAIGLPKVISYALVGLISAMSVLTILAAVGDAL